MSKVTQPKFRQPKALVIQAAAQKAAYQTAECVLRYLMLLDAVDLGKLEPSCTRDDYARWCQEEVVNLLDFIALLDAPANLPAAAQYRDPAHYLNYAAQTPADKERVQRALDLVNDLTRKAA